MPGLVLGDGPVDGAAALRLGGDEPGQAVDEADGVQVLQSLPEAGDGAAVAHGDGDVVRHLPVQLLHDLQGHGLLALGEVGVDGSVAVVPAPAVDGLLGEFEGLLIAALNGDDGGAEGHQLGHLSLGGTGGDEDVGLEARRRGVAREGRGGVAGGGAGDDLRPRLPGLGHRHGAGPVLQRCGGVLAVVLHPELFQTQLLRQAGLLVQGAPAHPQGGVGGLRLHRQQLPVPPHGVVLPGRQLLTGQLGLDVVVVVDNVQNAAALAVGQIRHRVVGLAALDAFAVQNVFHTVPSCLQKTGAGPSPRPRGV